METGGVCGLLSRLVHIWVMYSMVMDETHHVFHLFRDPLIKEATMGGAVTQALHRRLT